MIGLLDYLTSGLSKLDPFERSKLIIYFNAIHSGKGYDLVGFLKDLAELNPEHKKDLNKYIVFLQQEKKIIFLQKGKKGE